MKIINRFALPALMAFSCALSGLAAAATTGMDRDPPRWTTEDRTPQARYQTAKKEASAAYQDNLAQCRLSRPSERNACRSEARENFQRDMREARRALERREERREERRGYGR